MASNVRESDIQAAICDYLALKRYFFFRVNTTPIFDRTRGVFRAMPKYARKGVADILLLHDGVLYAVEVKAQRGRLSPDQMLFKHDVEQHGGVFVEARSIEDVQRVGL